MQSHEGMASYSKKSVEDMIHQYGDVELVSRNENGYDIFVLSNGVIIRLKAGFERIDLEYVVLIAEVKLRIPAWEFDYWLGEQDKSVN